jgi:mannose-6-phosphate isomerase-like protein (cupin superfamily)
MSDVPQPRPVTYVKPVVSSGKVLVKLCRTDRMIGIIQVIAKGGENNLHSHRHADGLWFVLSGRVRFYGEERRVIGEYGRHEGVLIPRGCPYWFEAVGDEPAEIMQLEAFDRAIPDDASLVADRVDHEERTQPKQAFVEAASVKA